MKNITNKSKSRIVIPDLIKRVRQSQADKQNICNNNKQCVEQSFQTCKEKSIINISNSFQEYQHNNQLSHNNCQESRDSQISYDNKGINTIPFVTEQTTQKNSIKRQGKQLVTNQSTYRSKGAQIDCLNQQSSIHESILTSELLGLKKKNNEINKLEQLLTSQKMFINPDRWTQYLNRALVDPKFHQSLNVFLYSYFLQNYN